MRVEETIDVTVRNEGSLFLFQPHTEAALEWIDENVGEHQSFAGAVVVEPRYAEDLALGMLDAGLVLR